jgi:hypothetical protein
MYKYTSNVSLETVDTLIKNTIEFVTYIEEKKFLKRSIGEELIKAKENKK